MTSDQRTAAGPECDGLFVARQAILDRDRRVFGYQLHVHAAPVGSDDAPGGEPGASAADALERCGLETLTVGRPAFMRMGLAQLGPAVQAVFPPGKVVVEIPPERQGEGGIAEECRALREAGYDVALEDFVLSPETEPLIPFATYVKVEFLSSSADQATACVSAARRNGAAAIATSVDAIEVLDEAVREGFEYFQGRLFEQRRFPPGTRVMPAGYLVYLDILKAVARPNLTVGELEDLVKRDAALSHQVLRLANSAALGQRRDVESIRQALMLIGRDTVRRWAALAVLAGLGGTQPSELLTIATVRARFCELLAERTGGAGSGGAAFLVGLCSMLDVILERPMPDVLDELGLGPDIRGTLLGRDTPLRGLLDCVVAYEHGDWTGSLVLADAARIAPRLLTPSYIDALRFAYELRDADRP